MINLQIVDIQQKPQLRDMLWLYLQELIPDTIPEYPYFDLYWTEGDRHPYFITNDESIIGFILVNKYHTIAQHPTPHTIAEFYIKPEFRQKGYGRAAAVKVFEQFEGNWEVRQQISNLTGIKFWRKVIQEYTQANYMEFHDAPNGRLIQVFES